MRLSRVKLPVVFLSTGYFLVWYFCGGASVLQHVLVKSRGSPSFYYSVCVDLFSSATVVYAVPASTAFWLRLHPSLPYSAVIYHA